MKLFVHSSLRVASLLLIGTLFLTSCEKDKEDPETASIPLINTAKYYEEDGEMLYSESYQYDNQGRMIRMDDSDDYHVTMEYAGTTVIVKNYEGDELSIINIVQLNSKGLGTSMSMNGIEDIATYEYDSNGYRKSSILQDGSSVSTTAFTVSEGNYVTSILTDQSNSENAVLAKKVAFLNRSSLAAKPQKRILPEPRLKSATANYLTKNDFQFYLDKINTIEYENMGISFMGKQNKNIIKQETSTVTYDGEVYGPDTITYSYEYDTKSRVTKQTSSEGDYSVYTYVD